MKGSEFLMVLILKLVFECSPVRAQFSLEYTADVVSNIKGGLKTGSGYLGLLEIEYTSGTGDLELWKNGKIHLHALLSHGESLSQTLTGDYQIFSNIEAGYYPGFFEFWVSQKIGQFEFTLGQHDLNSVFVTSVQSEVLLNSSFGTISSLSLNLPIPVFPIASPGFVVNYQAAPDWIISGGIYDGNPGNTETNSYNLEMDFSKEDGALTILEIEKQLAFWNEGVIKAGGYFHTGKFPYTDSLVALHEGNYGWFVLFDQELWQRKEGPGGLGAFLHLGFAPDFMNLVKAYQGMGFTWQGIFDKDQSDKLSFGIATSVFSTDKHLPFIDQCEAPETSLELTYQLYVANYLRLQPDFQLLLNPGGGYNLPNAWVVTFRIQLMAHRMLKSNSKKSKPVVF